MSLADRIPYAKESDIRYINHFDYIDRLIVFIYMTFAILAVVYIMQENATEAELAELSEPILFGGGVFDILGWILIFFLVWPVLRIPVKWLDRAIIHAGKRLYARLREAV